MQIESEFFNTCENVNLTEINRLITQVNNANNKQFDKTLELSLQAKQVYEWFTDSGKQEMREAGIVFTSRDLAEKVFKKSKSQFLKYVQCAKLWAESPIETPVTQFKNLCKEAEQQGKKAPKSLENFIKFLQAEPSNENGDEESGADVSTPDVIITLTLAKRSFEDGKGLSVKVYNNGVIKVNGDLNKIQTRLKTELRTLAKSLCADENGICDLNFIFEGQD